MPLRTHCTQGLSVAFKIDDMRPTMSAFGTILPQTPPAKDCGLAFR
jgi:hypothetical protein